MCFSSTHTTLDRSSPYGEPHLLSGIPISWPLCWLPTRRGRPNVSEDTTTIAPRGGTRVPLCRKDCFSPTWAVAVTMRFVLDVTMQCGTCGAKPAKPQVSTPRDVSRAWRTRSPKRLGQQMELRLTSASCVHWEECSRRSSAV